MGAAVGTGDEFDPGAELPQVLLSEMENREAPQENPAAETVETSSSQLEDHPEAESAR